MPGKTTHHTHTHTLFILYIRSELVKGIYVVIFFKSIVVFCLLLILYMYILYLLSLFIMLLKNNAEIKFET